MNNYQFEVAAKNAVLKVLKEKKDMELGISDLDICWFSHILGNKKCAIQGPKLCDYYIEVTYSRGKEELYVDIFNKESNTSIPTEELTFTPVKVSSPSK